MTLVATIFSIEGLNVLVNGVILLYGMYLGFMQWKIMNDVKLTRQNMNENTENGKKTLTFVNSAMGVQLGQTAALYRRLAIMPGSSSDDERAADIAKHAYEVHMTAQRENEAKDDHETGNHSDDSSL